MSAVEEAARAYKLVFQYRPHKLLPFRRSCSLIIRPAYTSLTEATQNALSAIQEFPLAIHQADLLEMRLEGDVTSQEITTSLALFSSHLYPGVDFTLWESFLSLPENTLSKKFQRHTRGLDGWVFLYTASQQLAENSTAKNKSRLESAIDKCLSQHLKGIKSRRDKLKAAMDASEASEDANESENFFEKREEA